MNNEPLLSVAMITYKHEAYIKKAIEGVLMQETNFEFHLIISDDCSPDTTPKIVQDLIDNHPKGYRIKYFRHEKNIGMQPNAIFVLKHCIGNYIALCEGDDYWTDPLKLQKQVDFLEQNEEFVISCSNAHIVSFKGDYIKQFNEHEIPENTDVNYILRNGWYIPTASVVFRNNMVELPNWFYKVQNGDYILYLLLTSNGGLVRYDNEVRCNYRIHENGASNVFKKKNAFNYSMLYNNKMFNNYSKSKYYSLIKINIENYSIGILESLPVLSIEFWQVFFNLVWFNKTFNRKLFLLLKESISLKMRSLKK